MYRPLEVAAVLGGRVIRHTARTGEVAVGTGEVAAVGAADIADSPTGLPGIDNCFNVDLFFLCKEKKHKINLSKSVEVIQKGHQEDRRWETKRKSITLSGGGYIIEKPLKV